MLIYCIACLIILPFTRGCLPLNPKTGFDSPVVSSTIMPTTISTSTVSPTTTTEGTTTAEPLPFAGRRFQLIYDHVNYPRASRLIERGFHSEKPAYEKVYQCQHGRTAILPYTTGTAIPDLAQTAIICDEELLCAHTNRGSFRHNADQGEFRMYSNCKSEDECTAIVDPRLLVDEDGAINKRGGAESSDFNLIRVNAVQCVQQPAQCTEEAFQRIKSELDAGCSELQIPEGFRIPSYDELFRQNTLKGEACSAPSNHSAVVFAGGVTEWLTFAQKRNPNCRFEKGEIRFWAHGLTGVELSINECRTHTELCLLTKDGELYQSSNHAFRLLSHCENERTCYSVVLQSDAQQVYSVANPELIYTYDKQLFPFYKWDFSNSAFLKNVVGISCGKCVPL